MIPIRGRSIPEAWLQGAEYLNSRKAEGRMAFDLFLEIAEPFRVSGSDRAVWTKVNDFLERGGGYPISTVAETIFPMPEYRQKGFAWLENDYYDWAETIRKNRKDGGWGNYAQRLWRQWDHAGKPFSPLGDLVRKIGVGRPNKACYELGLQWPFEAELATYDPARDRKPFMGHLPCLSHVSIKVHDGSVRLHGLYRSHYYIQRAFGNLVGLAYLQAFIAHEAKLNIGPLTVHSTYAKIDTGADNRKHWTQREIDALLRESHAIYVADSVEEAV